jgi:hypothetical protein
MTRNHRIYTRKLGEQQLLHRGIASQMYFFIEKLLHREVKVASRKEFRLLGI